MTRINRLTNIRKWAIADGPGSSGDKHRNQLPLHRERPGSIEHQIAAQILRKGRNGILPFPRAMEIALFAPVSHGQEGGYYPQQAVEDGCLKHFGTRPELHSPDFGQGVAVKIQSCFEKLGRPSPFKIVIMGDGTGTLAKDIMDYLQQEHPSLYSAVELTLIDRSLAPLDVQREKLKEHHSKTTFLYQNAYQDHLPEAHIFLSNENPDTFPVHLIEQDADGSFGEYGIKATEREKCFPPMFEFELALVPGVSQEIRDHIKLAGKPFPRQRQMPINLIATQWIKRITRSMKRGYHFVLDYGFTGTAYPNEDLIWNTSPYQPTNMSAFLTLEFGHRDITTYVDFDTLRIAGEAHGASTELLDYEEEFFRGTGITLPSQQEVCAQLAEKQSRFSAGKIGHLALVQAIGI
ncbi:MAG: SAM-dependent methyltransferase [Candidatus Saganbacteria bacterium]|nr:SAM-dependent methyltransferase [Candidatus Saganbacteria bacterium]